MGTNNATNFCTYMDPNFNTDLDTHLSSNKRPYVGTNESAY